MAGRTKFGDLVIIVPGIFGSRLVHHGSPLWGDDSANFLQWVRTRTADLAHLSVGADDPTLDDLGDGITPDGLIRRWFVVGRFATVGGYAQLTEYLQKRFALKLGENLQHFAYDWRRDLRVSSRRLATKAEGWLHAWRARSGNRDAKIVLLCHAMGGLVGRAFADIEGGWPAVRALVTIGTPFLGSIRALDLLYFGLDFQSYGLALHDLTSVARTLTSVYQLLPHYPAIRTFAGETVSPFDIRIPTFEQQKIERARQLHRDVVDHQERNRAKAGYAEMDSRSIIGIGQNTVEGARLLANGTLAIDRHAALDENDGDGNVPRFSAEAPAPVGFAGQWSHLPQSHGMLIADPLVHAQIGDILAGGRGGATRDTPLPRLRLRRALDGTLRVDGDALSLSVSQPFQKIGRPIEIRIGAHAATRSPFDAGSMRIGVKVEHVGATGRRVAAQRLRVSYDRRNPGWWTSSLRPAAPGTYRVTASSNHRLLAPFQVSAFFEVDTGK